MSDTYSSNWGRAISRRELPEKAHPISELRSIIDTMNHIPMEFTVARLNEWCLRFIDVLHVTATIDVYELKRSNCAQEIINRNFEHMQLCLAEQLIHTANWRQDEDSMVLKMNGSIYVLSDKKDRRKELEKI